MPETKKILLVDDDMDILTKNAEALGDGGFDLIQAIDGEEAWEAICSHDPDVIVLDIGLPKMDGLTVLKQLRANPPSEKRAAVIILSACGGMEDIKRGMSSDADEYLVKPIKPEVLRKTVQAIIERLSKDS